MESLFILISLPRDQSVLSTLDLSPFSSQSLLFFLHHLLAFFIDGESIEEDREKKRRRREGKRLRIISSASYIDISLDDTLLVLISSA